MRVRCVFTTRLVEPLYERALAIWEKALGPEPPDVAAILNELAALYSAQSLYAKAEPLHLHALALREKVLGPEHSGVAMSLNNLASVYKAQGRYAEAEPLFERALTLSEKALGPEHPNTATVRGNLAITRDARQESRRGRHLNSANVARYFSNISAACASRGVGASWQAR